MARRIRQPAIVLGLCLLVTPGLEGGVFEVDSVIPDSPSPCGFQPWSEQRVLPVVGGPQLVHAFVGEPYALSRTEERDGFRYLLEEWTVVAIDGEAGGSLRSIETLAASSTAYGDFLRDSLVTTVEASSRPEWLRTFNAVGRGPLLNYVRPGRSIVLVIEAPPHVHNDRWIPTPVVRWSAGATPPSPGAPGRAVVRLDFAEDRSLARFDVLYADRPLSPAEHDVIEHRLGLDYASDKRHRAALFAVLSLGETIDLERGIVVVQQCCCTGPSATCIPHPG